ncbi:RES domain-containing protein [Rhodococcus sp. ACPA4]|uniref:RES domain-containing protein n=1 Tax=Rhodococcus sp. ACPA4 TaxID=2028571 RepID=UPI0015CE4E82|nr:RES domain-containing protein [Rhodococcus sp. ACPA4]
MASPQQPPQRVGTQSHRATGRVFRWPIRLPRRPAYAYLYIADSPDGAIAETICRDLPLDPTVARIVPASVVAGRTLTALTLTRTLTVAALHGPHLSAVGRDLWLTKCEARHYVATRRWAHAIHAADPVIGGLAYRPRRNEDTLAWVLTTDPAVTSHPALAVDSSFAALPLDRGRGRDLVERIVADHSAISPQHERMTLFDCSAHLADVADVDRRRPCFTRQRQVRAGAVVLVRFGTC